MMHVSPTPNRHTHTHACLGESWRESICHGLLTLLSSYSQHSLPPPNSGCYYHCPDAKRAQQPSQRGQMFHVSCGGTTSNFSSSYPSWWLDKFSSPLSAIMKLHTSWFWQEFSKWHILGPEDILNVAQSGRSNIPSTWNEHMPSCYLWFPSWCLARSSSSFNLSRCVKNQPSSDS